MDPRSPTLISGSTGGRIAARATAGTQDGFRTGPGDAARLKHGVLENGPVIKHGKSSPFMAARFRLVKDYNSPRYIHDWLVLFGRFF